MSIFDSKKKETGILDCFTYDLTSFFYDEYEEIDSEETPATVMIVYEKKLPWLELGIFDTVQFRIFFDKESITGSNPINVRFISKSKIPTIENLEFIIKKILSIYGGDDLGRKTWTEADKNNFDDKKYRRVWTIEKGESFVSIESHDENTFSLNVLFFNNMLTTSNSVELQQQ